MSDPLAKFWPIERVSEAMQSSWDSDMLNMPQPPADEDTVRRLVAITSDFEGLRSTPSRVQWVACALGDMQVFDVALVSILFGEEVGIEALKLRKEYSRIASFPNAQQADLERLRMEWSGILAIMRGETDLIPDAERLTTALSLLAILLKFVHGQQRLHVGLLYAWMFWATGHRGLALRLLANFLGELTPGEVTKEQAALIANQSMALLRAPEPRWVGTLRTSVTDLAERVPKEQGES